jgi:branched-chain amino acid transport system substrate-binding protein
MKTINKWVLGLGILVVVLLAVINEQGKSDFDKQATVKLGAILELTGSNASSGENARLGIEMAVEEINANGGILGKKVEIDFQDNLGDNPAGALSALNILANKNVRIIVGPSQTPSANVVAPTLSKLNVLMIAPSVGSEKFAEASELSFNVFPPNKFESLDLAKYLYEHEGYRKIAIFGYKQEWSIAQTQFLRQGFEDLGGKVTIMEHPEESNVDLRTESLKVKDSNPEAVVFTNWNLTGIAARRLREVGATVPFYSVMLPVQQIDGARGALENLIFISTDTVNTEFNEKFMAKYGHNAGFPVAQGYDAMRILAEAIARAKSMEPADVASKLNQIGMWHGESGDITFDKDGNAHKPVNYYKVINGQVTEHKAL